MDQVVYTDQIWKTMKTYLTIKAIYAINRIAEVVERRNIGFLDVGAIPTVSTKYTCLRIKV